METKMYKTYDCSKDWKNTENPVELANRKFSLHDNCGQREENQKDAAQSEMGSRPNEDDVVGQTVERGDGEEEKEHEEIPLVVVPDAVPDKSAMVVTLEDANATHRTVPGTRWCPRLALSAMPPTLTFFGRQEEALDTGVNEEESEEVALEAHQEVSGEGTVEGVDEAAWGVEVWEHYKQLEPVEEWENDEQEEASQ